MPRPLTYPTLLVILGALVMNSGCNTVAVNSAAGVPYDKTQIVADDFAARQPAASLMSNVREWSEASRTFALRRGDTTYDFPSGRSYFRTFALPKDAAGRSLEIRSYYSKDFPTTLFVPALMFLDAQGQLIADLPAPKYEIRNVLGEHIKLIERIPAGAAYITLYTSPTRVAERMTFQTYSMASVVPATFNTHNTGFGGFYEGILKLAVREN